MRCDQSMGLNERALAIIAPVYRKYQDKITRTYEDGETVSFQLAGTCNLVKCEPSGEYEGFDTHRLMKYTLPNGDVYQEFVQAEPWSSGPCTFLALKDKTGNEVKESLWTDQEIESHL